MIKDISIYLDESGDLGFDLQKKGSSKYFVVALLVCENQETVKGIKRAVIRTLKNKLNAKKNKRRKIYELKGAKTEQGIRNYFYRNLPQNGWGIYSASLNKSKVYEYLRTRVGKQKLYNFLAKFLIEKIDFPDTLENLNLVVDKCKNTEEIKDFNAYLSNQLQASIPNLDVRFNINHDFSHINHELQAVDLFCWGIARKVSCSETEWYDVFRCNIKFETVYLE